MTPSVLHCLEMKERTRTKRLAKIKANETKKDRIKRKHDDLVRDEVIAKRERAKRQGAAVYKSGINMNDEDVVEAPSQKKRGPVVCRHCGLKGHVTTKAGSACSTPAQ
jgi:hypothetical protein